MFRATTVFSVQPDLRMQATLSALSVLSGHLYTAAGGWLCCCYLGRVVSDAKVPTTPRGTVSPTDSVDYA